MLKKINKEEYEENFIKKELYADIPSELLREMEKQIESQGSIEKFLVYKKAIKLNEKGTWIVLYYPNMGMSIGQPMVGFNFTTDFPYHFWQHAIEQLIKLTGKQNYAKDTDYRILLLKYRPNFLLKVV